MLTFDRPWNDCRLEYFLESLNETLTKIQLTTFIIAFPPWRIDRRPSICQLAQPERLADYQRKQAIQADGRQCLLLSDHADGHRHVDHKIYF